MKILISYEKKMPKMKSGSDKDKIVDWAGELYKLGKFRESTGYAHGLSLADGNKTLKEEGKLRIDRQRVIGINEKTIITNQYRIGNLKKGNIQTFDSEEAAKKALGKKKAKITTIKYEITLADHVWTLFAAQIDNTHNQIFVYNNCNYLNALGEDKWKQIWQSTLDNGCTAIISKDTATVPNGFDEAYDASMEFE